MHEWSSPGWFMGGCICYDENQWGIIIEKQLSGLWGLLNHAWGWGGGGELGGKVKMRNIRTFTYLCESQWKYWTIVCSFTLKPFIPSSFNSNGEHCLSAVLDKLLGKYCVLSYELLYITWSFTTLTLPSEKCSKPSYTKMAKVVYYIRSYFFFLIESTLCQVSAISVIHIQLSIKQIHWFKNVQFNCLKNNNPWLLHSLHQNWFGNKRTSKQTMCST